MDIIHGMIHGIPLLMHGDGTILGIMAHGAGVGADLGIMARGVGDGIVLGMAAGTAAVAGMAVDIIIVQTIHIPVVLDMDQAADTQLIIIQDAITPDITTRADILHIAEDAGLLLM